jgi:hypothetical protein
MADNRKQVQTQGEASPLQGNNASGINGNSDAVGPEVKVITVSQSTSGGGNANTTKGI